jgi:hypothetical protein
MGSSLFLHVFTRVVQRLVSPFAGGKNQERKGGLVAGEPEKPWRLDSRERKTRRDSTLLCDSNPPSRT